MGGGGLVEKKSFGLRVVLPLVGSMLVGTSPVFAASPLPGSAEPGRIEKQFQKIEPPKSTLEPAVPAAPSGRLAPSEASKIHLTLSRLDISGATAFGDAELRTLYEKYLGKNITVADLYEIADAITVKYRNAGYVLSHAVVPEQTIHTGIARVVVVEGFVGKVRIEGSRKNRSGLFDAYSNKIMASRPLKLSILERYLLLAQDLPGITVRSVFEPEKGVVGASTLVIYLDNKPIDAQASVDNRGTKTLGPIEATLSADFNGILGLFERTGFTVVGTPQSELRYYRMTHEGTLDSEGTKATAAVTYVKTQPGGILAPLDVEGRDTALSFSLSHPFIRSRAENLSLGLDFTYRNATTDELSVRTAEDHIRALSASASYDFTDRWRGISQVNAVLSRGLPIFDASKDDNPLPSRTNGTATFTKLTLYASRTQGLIDRFSLFAQAGGQWSANSLLASEQFGVGGSQYGRAYDSSEITGDDGVAGGVELRYKPPLPVPALRSSELFTYYDIGKVWSRFHPGASSGQSAASAGFGYRLAPLPFLSGAVEIDKPLTYTPADTGDRGWRVFFQLTARY